MSISFRIIKKEEEESLEKTIREAFPWVPSLNLKGTLVKEKDGEIVAAAQTQYRVLVEPMWAESGPDAHDIAVAIDNRLGQMGINEYEFFVPDCNSKYQDFIEKHYGIEGVREIPGKTYFVRRENANRKIIQPEKSGSESTPDSARGVEATAT